MKIPYGNDFLGSDKIETSTANQEIVPSPDASWTDGYSFYKFLMINYTDAVILVNGKTKLFIPAFEGFVTDMYDPVIHSFVIVNAGVKYRWVGAY